MNDFFEELSLTFIKNFPGIDFSGTTLLLTGSYAEGFQNSKSDYDFILLSDFNNILEGNGNNYHITIINGKRAEILLLTYQDFLISIESIYENTTLINGHRKSKFLSTVVLWDTEEYRG
ncbi:hypothetical protein OHW91_18320, partial [Acinetobacter baumannii]|nr:hypothetical protein [Acinetobacter baumannii]